MKRRSLKLKTILISFTAALICTTLLLSGILSFRMFENSMIKKIGDSRVDVLSQISEKISAVKVNAESLSNLFYYNENITDFYQTDGYSQEDEQAVLENFRRIEELSAMTSAVTEMEFYYTFLMENGFCYSSNPADYTSRLEDYTGQLWFPEVEEYGERWIPTHRDVEGKQVISIARSLKDADGNFIGLFLFHIYEDTFSQTYQNLLNENSIYIVDAEGNIVSHKDKELLGIRFYDMDLLGRLFQKDSSISIQKSQREYLFSIVRNSELNWILAEEIPMELLLSDVNNIQIRMIGIGAGLFLIGLLVCIYIAFKTTKPLGELVHELEHVGKSGEEEQKFEIRGWDEIHRICEECNYMTRRIHSLVTEIKESERKKRAAEMGFLQSQMSPHFLYNTLFSIRCLVDMGAKERAIGIIDAFTSILKYILSYKSEFVDISQEIKFLEDYAVLQKYRYGDQFSLQINCAPELYQKKMVRMILEPLVENSLFHGLGDGVEKISVVVEFKIENGDLLVTVTNDGVGFTDENCMRLNKKLRENEQSNMIGMNNIRNLLKEMFGKKYGLSIDMNYTKGARTIVKIPVLE